MVTSENSRFENKHLFCGDTFLPISHYSQSELPLLVSPETTGYIRQTARNTTCICIYYCIPQTHLLVLPIQRINQRMYCLYQSNHRSYATRVSHHHSVNSFFSIFFTFVTLLHSEQIIYLCEDSSSQHIQTRYVQSLKLKHQYTNTSIYQYINTPIHQYTNTSVHQHINTPIHQYINTSHQYNDCWTAPFFLYRSP